MTPGGTHGRGGRHHHDDVDWAAMATYMSAWDDVAKPVHRAITAWLGVGDGDVVVDVGSGAGGMTAVLADAVGATGTVIAVDGDAVLLDVARRRAERPDRHVVTVHADLEQQELRDVLPPPTADLVHASAVVHHFDDELRAIRELAAVVRPGGRIALVEGGLGTRCLPADCGIGEPGLEQRLATAQEAWFWSEVRPAFATVRTGRGWGTLLDAAGLVDVAARSFLLDVPPPLDEPTRKVVRDAFAAQAARVGDRLDEDDRETLRQLLDPDNPHGVMRRPDVHLLRATTVHVGTVAA
jgi:ubiquinone/menaquinone biosynthesis C-methylase UbiE